MKIYNIIRIVILVSIGSINLFAQWSIDSRINNAVSNAANDQFGASIINDGEGGSIITWGDYRNNNADIYAQRINSLGEVQWITDGVAVSNAANDQYRPTIISDGKGGAIITWGDYRNNNADIYAQRISSLGKVQWSTDGVAISIASLSQRLPSIISDGEGGAIIMWYDDRNNYVNTDIYAQRINSFGAVQWAPDGVKVATNSIAVTSSPIISDGFGGAIITWRDLADGVDISAQRINSSGKVMWGADGRFLTGGASNQVNPSIISDGEGGAIITWEDYRNGIDFDIYAQRVNSFGEVQWIDNGFAVSTAADNQSSPIIVSDGKGGAIITWIDYRSNSTQLLNGLDIYAQRINSVGKVLWSGDGEIICAADQHQSSHSIISDEEGGAIISWADQRNGNSNNDIYSQRINSIGEVQWTPDGVAISTAVNDQRGTSIASDDEGGAIVTWEDGRNINDDDIYAQRITALGYLGMANPSLLSISDVQEDQGGKVNVVWNASSYDVNTEKLIEYYSIWRGIELNGNEALSNIIESQNMKIDFKGKAYLIEEAASGNLYWEWLGNTPTHYLSSYSYQVETQSDSSSMNSTYTKYFVSAHTDDQFLFWDSKIDSGYSVDNLSPLAPQQLSAAMLPGAIVGLTWAQNRIDKDVRDYVVYRSTENDFTLSPSTQIAIVTDTVYVDENLPGDTDKLYYRVVTRDIHDNESEPSNSTSIVLTSVNKDLEKLPTEYNLSQNYPNPFNPNTVIQYSIPKQSNVTLKVFDVLGSELKILINEDHSAGNYTVEFNAVDYPSGVYFYRIQAGNYSHTMKMILTK